MIWLTENGAFASKKDMLSSEKNDEHVKVYRQHLYDIAVKAERDAYNLQLAEGNGYW